MFWKLSLRNIRHSMEEYGFYFITQTLLAAVYYAFHALDRMENMMSLTPYKITMMQTLQILVNVISVILAVIMAALLVYANYAMVRRRNREFFIFSVQGMSQLQIARLLIQETVLVGIVSIAAGLVLGVFSSQFLLLWVAELFQAEISNRGFLFSPHACLDTLLCFGLMYVMVVFFHLCYLFFHGRKRVGKAQASEVPAETHSYKLSVCVLILSLFLLGFCYRNALHVWTTILSRWELLWVLAGLVVGTFLFFWSLSHLLVSAASLHPERYLQGTRMFLIRSFFQYRTHQIAGLTVCCLMLFATITAISTCLGLVYSIDSSLMKRLPADIDILCEEDAPISDILKENGFDLELFADYADADIYIYDSLPWSETLGSYADEALEKYPALMTDEWENVMHVSDYNAVARVFGLQTYSLADDEYMIVCNYEVALDVRNEALKREAVEITVNGVTYQPKYRSCQDGFIFLSMNAANAGIILLPDSAIPGEDAIHYGLLVASYQGGNEQEKMQIDSQFMDENSELMQSLYERGVFLDCSTRLLLLDTRAGIVAVTTYLCIYIGIALLLISCVLLTLRALNTTVDHKKDYQTLKRIGCDRNMLQRTLHRQMAISFYPPLILAMIHSVFGIICLNDFVRYYIDYSSLPISVITAAILIGGIFFIYLCTAYYDSRQLLRE